MQNFDGDLPDLPLHLARLKAEHGAKKVDDGLVLSGDTIIVFDGVVMGKPKGKDEARAFINRLSGHWHDVLSGICIKDAATQRTVSGSEVTKVHFMEMTEDEVEFYLENEKDLMYLAGGYAIQGLASLFIDRIEGCYPNVVGLPMNLLHRMLKVF
jgi:septum formation protein